MIYTVTFNPAIDYVVRLDTPLEVGEVNRAKGEDCVLGGKGINVSGVLAELGCRMAQGYLVSPPVPASMEAWARSNFSGDVVK